MILNGGLNSCGGIVSFDLNNKCRFESILSETFDVCTTRELLLSTSVTREKLEEVLRQESWSKIVLTEREKTFDVTDTSTSVSVKSSCRDQDLAVHAAKSLDNLVASSRETDIPVSKICETWNAAVGSSRSVNLSTCYSKCINLEVTIDVER